MEMRGNVKVEAEVTINDREALVLAHLCSYDLAHWFSAKCSNKFTVEQIKQALTDVRQQAEAIVAAKDKALESFRAKGA